MQIRNLAVFAAIALAYGCSDRPTAPNASLETTTASATLAASESEGLEFTPMSSPLYQVECPSTELVVGYWMDCGAYFYGPPIRTRVWISHAWSLDPSIATYGTTERVHGLSPGTARIGSTSAIDGMWYTDTLTITVVLPDPLSVSIDGPSTIHPLSIYCSWEASTSGGYIGKTYQWYKDEVPVGTGPSYQVFSPFSGDFTLAVHVTDSGGGSSWAQKSVTVTNQGAGAC